MRMSSPSSYAGTDVLAHTAGEDQHCNGNVAKPWKKVAHLGGTTCLKLLV